MNTKTVKTCQSCGSGVETARHWNCPICGESMFKPTMTVDRFFAMARDNENDFRNLVLETHRKSNV